jgi:DNA-binding NarL/FixJ family response regulator
MLADRVWNAPCYERRLEHACMERFAISKSGAAVELMSLSELWFALTTGKLTIVSSGCSERECFLRLCPRREQGAFFLAPRHRSILRRVLAGESQKSVAIELELAVSTIAVTGSHLLAAMGARVSASRAPLLLALAAHAATGVPLPAALLARTRDCASDEFVLIAPRPDIELAASLSAAERDVVRALVEGRTYAEIAAHRRRSKRTIANQLASIFRKLRVRGRGELVGKLVREVALGRSLEAFA